jgi:chromosome segregation ATPase
LRLSMEEVQKFKKDLESIKDGIPTVELNISFIKKLIDAIEAQQQKIEQIKKAIGEWKYDSECHMDEVIASKKENEQLQSRVAAMREALEQFKYDYEQGENKQNNYLEVCKLLRNEAGKDYHNPADVVERYNVPVKLMGQMPRKKRIEDDYHNLADLEALKLAYNALKHVQVNNAHGFEADIGTKDEIQEVLTALDRILGGDTP